MPWILSLIQSLAASGRSSQDQSYNAFLRSVASKVVSDGVKNSVDENSKRFIDG